MIDQEKSPKSRRRLWIFGGVAALSAAGFWTVSHSMADTVIRVPAPVADENESGKTSETVVLAGGCFWGVQDVFQHVKGVTQAVSGYSGGAKDTAQYEIVSGGETGHAESVQVTFDPRVISFGKILQVYFSVAHDPTELNHQGPDTGTQYRSAIFTTDSEQAKVAETYVSQLDSAHVFPDKIVTKIGPVTGFYQAEGYHQDYATLHPDNPYISFNDLPKVDNLSKLFPDLYQKEPVLVRLASNTN